MVFDWSWAAAEVLTPQCCCTFCSVLARIPLLRMSTTSFVVQSLTADEQFVRALAESHNLPVHIHVAPDLNDDARRGSSLQATCRDIRYNFFADVLREEGGRHLALGHTLDDQAETVILHLARGTGVDGFAGMPCVRLDHRGYTVLRPLLSTSRDELIDTATRLGIQWREDASNESDHYTRSRVRRSVVPAVTAAMGKHAWLNVGKSANRIRTYLDADEAGHIDEYVELVVRGDRSADVETLASLQPVVRRRILLALLKRWYPEAPRNAAVAAQIDDLLTRETGKSFLHDAVHVVRDRDVLHFRPPPAADDPGVAQLAPGGTVRFDGSTYLRIDSCNVPDSFLPASKNVVFVDAVHVPGTLAVRRWKAGDRFAPLGMSGSKLVSDLLTDRKVATTEREGIAVVVAGEDIVWCVGIEIGARFRVTDGTRRVTALVRLPE